VQRDAVGLDDQPLDIIPLLTHDPLEQIGRVLTDDVAPGGDAREKLDACGIRRRREEAHHGGGHWLGLLAAAGRQGQDCRGTQERAHLQARWGSDWHGIHLANATEGNRVRLPSAM
jgi:hypothetical protein